MTTATPPDDPMLLVHAYVDGELDPANALALERQMAADPALAAERDRIEALRSALQTRLPRDPVPASLRARIDNIGRPPRMAERPSWRALAASVALAALVGSSATYVALGPQIAGRPEAVSDAVLAGHVRGLSVPQPYDVASSDRHTVKPWFNGRGTLAPRVVDLAKVDFPLAGGRLDVVDRSVVPTLVYRHGKHVISLTEVPARGQKDAAPVRSTAAGYNVVHWTENGIAYWAVSDTAVAELDDFVVRFRATPEDQ